MRERVDDLIGPRSRAMWVLTFHSACLRILRREAHRLGWKQSFTIYDTDDARRLLTQIVKDLGLDSKKHSPRWLAAEISRLKNELIGPDQAASSADDARAKLVADVYSQYDERLRLAQAVDFDDIIGSTVHLFRAFPEVAKLYRMRFRHVMVDEYQDTNHAQYTLVRELVGTGDDRAELCVVGDADQSIYAFRGATIRNIIEFERDFPDAKTILLEQNYRSTQTILDAANGVIRNNTERGREKRLWSDEGPGGRILGHTGDNEHDEAAWVAGRIDELVDAKDTSFGDTAIFYRTNAQSRAFEEVFVRRGIPYKVVGGVRFYERKEVRDMLAYLKLTANPDDTVSAMRVVNTPKRGVGDRAVAEVEALAARLKVSFPEALHRADEAPGSPAGPGPGSGSSARSSTPQRNWRRPRRPRRSSTSSSPTPGTSTGWSSPRTRRTRAASRTSRSSWPSRTSSPSRSCAARPTTTSRTSTPTCPRSWSTWRSCRTPTRSPTPRPRRAGSSRS
nr:hypothetical protein GCM10025732_01230 [Glycomyces mayteni]